MTPEQLRTWQAQEQERRTRDLQGLSRAQLLDRAAANLAEGGDSAESRAIALALVSIGRSLDALAQGVGGGAS